MTDEPAPAAFLLDVDGVLVDTEGRWDGVERRLLDRAGATDVPRSAVRGVSTAETYDLLAERTDLGVDRETFRAWYDEAAREDVYGESPTLPGAGALVDDARAAGVPVAVVSSAAPGWIAGVLDRVAEADATVSGDEDGLAGKPAGATRHFDRRSD